MTPPSIQVRNLRRTFGGFLAVDNVTFAVQKGEIFGYLGANGAGKSTTIRMLCGLLAPSGGEAIVAGCPVHGNTTKLRSQIGYMSQKFSLYLDLTVEANIEFFGGAYGLAGKALRRRRDEILEQTGLKELRGTTTGELPGGTRQRLALGTALLHHPSVVFLDEPTAGVDPISRRVFWTLIRELGQGGTTVFVTTHYMDEAEYCARIGLMVKGKLVALDTPEGLKRTWVPGTVMAISHPDVNQVRDTLSQVPGILSVEPFGKRAHVRFDSSQMDATRLTELLAPITPGPPRLEPAEASLEDVFLAAVASKPATSSAEGAK